MKFKELESKVLQWADERGIIVEDDLQAEIQFGKTKEEVKEVLEAINNTFLVPAQYLDDARHKVKLEIGDAVVTLITGAACFGTTVEECLELAYEKIKNRKGKTVNGVFIKEEDL